MATKTQMFVEFKNETDRLKQRICNLTRLIKCYEKEIADLKERLSRQDKACTPVCKNESEGIK
ncbi:MAG: hypothetical protein LBD50_01080, partial [Rickettsiales bacterium]|nr:hypothetical protein [Rickettsiales bacterium]